MMLGCLLTSLTLAWRLGALAMLRDCLQHDFCYDCADKPLQSGQCFAALERQDLSCTYLAHHELESV